MGSSFPPIHEQAVPSFNAEGGQYFCIPDVERRSGCAGPGVGLRVPVGPWTTGTQSVVHVPGPEPVLPVWTTGPERNARHHPLVRRETVLRVSEPHVPQGTLWSLHPGRSAGQNTIKPIPIRCSSKMGNSFRKAACTLLYVFPAIGVGQGS